MIIIFVIMSFLAMLYIWVDCYVDRIEQERWESLRDDLNVSDIYSEKLDNAKQYIQSMNRKG